MFLGEFLRPLFVAGPSYGEIAMIETKDSATTAKAWKKMLPRIESQSSPGRPEDYRVETFQHDHGTEFEGAFEAALLR